MAIVCCTEGANKCVHIPPTCFRKPSPLLNSSLPGENGRLFADDIFRCIFVNEIFFILIKISLKVVPKGAIDNNPTLVYIMAWCRLGDKPLSEPMLIRFTDAYMVNYNIWCATRGHFERYVPSISIQSWTIYNVNADDEMMETSHKPTWHDYHLEPSHSISSLPSLVEYVVIVKSCGWSAQIMLFIVDQFCQNVSPCPSEILNSYPPNAAYMRRSNTTLCGIGRSQWAVWALVQVMACRLLGAKPLPEPKLTDHQLDP